MGIGKKIKELRKQVGLTQPELAERVGVHETTIRRWEQERDKGPDAGMIKKIAEVLNTTGEELLAGVTPQEQKTDMLNMAVMTLENGKRIEAPATPEGYAFLERLFAMSLSGSAQAV
ncbi:MAG: helix-turn-helix transcriptional regulator [Synergistaceae bacterium]|nr:helix-turn-helix transcriptional regulator [Synergistaceae bacterium]